VRKPTVDECRAALRAAEGEERDKLLRRYARDSRASVRDLARAGKRRDGKEAAERDRLVAMTVFQAELHERGLMLVAGVDEVGRGALAGPLTACAVILPVDLIIEGLDDSKRLTPQARGEVAERIRVRGVASCIAHAEPEEIDRVGIGEATRLAMGRAVSGLGVLVDHVLVDGNDARIGFDATAVVGGDSKCACIAAASVVAKVTRDALMERLAEDHPAYGFEINKGYGTPEHLEAIRVCGISPVHRRSFAPCGGTQPLF
jgi:ribonuclease HII